MLNFNLDGFLLDSEGYVVVDDLDGEVDDFSFLENCLPEMFKATIRLGENCYCVLMPEFKYEPILKHLKSIQSFYVLEWQVLSSDCSNLVGLNLVNPDSDIVRTLQLLAKEIYDYWYFYSCNQYSGSFLAIEAKNYTATVQDIEQAREELLDAFENRATIKFLGRSGANVTFTEMNFEMNSAHWHTTHWQQIKMVNDMTLYCHDFFTFISKNFDSIECLDTFLNYLYGIRAHVDNFCEIVED